eukprot:GGOE01036683.1.p1 GENE.GGOE01036683.1~~GGOE01036683.1.p1  ORF type:complete len:209 (+),score=70.65 GGOE01036683.1:79-705(+)
MNDEANKRFSWDKAEYEVKAKERLAKTLEELKSNKFGRTGRLPPPANPKRDWLKGRDYDLNIEDKAGRTQVANMGLPAAQQAGFYCKTCDCVVKDSQNYLDHINGKKHQRNLGMSMRVERVTVDQVRRKFADLKRRREEEAAAKAGDFEAKLQEKHDEFERQERERRELKKQRRKEKERLDQAVASGEFDPDSAALQAMGLPTGFGGR